VIQEAAKYGAPDQPGFYTDEIELRLEVIAGGELRIFGSGAEANTRQRHPCPLQTREA
jgi:hypothetical protein